MGRDVRFSMAWWMDERAGGCYLLVALIASPTRFNKPRERRRRIGTATTGSEQLHTLNTQLLQRRPLKRTTRRAERQAAQEWSLWRRVELDGRSCVSLGARRFGDPAWQSETGTETSTRGEFPGPSQVTVSSLRTRSGQRVHAWRHRPAAAAPGEEWSEASNR
jgi:hypothetical protein